jgi:hypothetical protein
MFGWFSAETALGFLLGAPQPLAVLSQRAGQNFDRHLAAQARVLRAIHFARPARADGRFNFERT